MTLYTCSPESVAQAASVADLQAPPAEAWCTWTEGYGFQHDCDVGIVTVLILRTPMSSAGGGGGGGGG